MAELTGAVAYSGARQPDAGQGDDRRQSPGLRTDKVVAGGFAYPHSVTITPTGGSPQTYPSGRAALVWQGSVAASEASPTYTADFRAHRWYVFHAPSNMAGRLFLCKAQEWLTVSGAIDALKVEYQTREGWRRAQPKHRPCIPLAARMQILAGTIASGDAVGDDSTVRFFKPGKMAINPTDGALFVIDAGNGKIKRRDAATFLWTTVLTDANLLPAVTSAGGSASPGSGLTFAANGDLYYSHHATSSFNLNTLVRVPHGSSSGSALTTTGLLPFLNATIGGGMAVSLDQATLYLPQPGFLGVHQVYALDLASGVIAVYAGAGGRFPRTSSPGDYYDATRNASTATAYLPSPADVYVDPVGRPYFISGDLAGISRVELDGSVTRLTGTSLYVSSGGDVPTFGTTGSDYFGDGAAATTQYVNALGALSTGSFKNAFSLDVSDCFDLVVADSDDLVIRTIAQDGTLATLAGGPRNNHTGATIGTQVLGAPITSPILAAGPAVDANAYGLPGKPVAVRARPRSQGGGVFVALNGSAHCILLLS